MSRVSVVLLALVCALSVRAGEPGTSESFTGPVGLQLYSLRAEFMSAGVAKTLDQVKSFGITNVELAGVPQGVTLEQYKSMLAERGLKPVSGHFPYDRYKADPDGVANPQKVLPRGSRCGEMQRVPDGAWI